MIFFPSTQIFWKLWECTLLKIYIYIYIFKKNQLKNAQLFYCWIDIVRWFSYLDIMTRACGHKQLCSSFFYHANGTVFTTDDSMSVLISLLLLLCFVFFKIMPTLLLRHILGLEKSTAACFQPPFARTVQAQHWSTPQTQTEQSLAQNKLIFIRAFPQLHGRRRPDAWCFWSLTPAEVPVGLNLFPVFALRLPRLVGSQDSRRVAFVWLQCFFPHLASNQTKCPDIFFFF